MFVLVVWNCNYRKFYKEQTVVAKPAGEAERGTFATGKMWLDHNHLTLGYELGSAFQRQ